MGDFVKRIVRCCATSHQQMSKLILRAVHTPSVECDDWTAGEVRK